MDYGPVPSFALNEMSVAIGGSEVSVSAESDANVFARVLNVKKLFHSHPRFEVKDGAYDESVFSDSERSAPCVTRRTCTDT